MIGPRSYRRYRTNAFLVAWTALALVVVWGLAQMLPAPLSAGVPAPTADDLRRVAPAAPADRTARPGPDTPRLSQAPPALDGPIADLRSRQLSVPVDGVPADALDDTFGDPRDRVRQHEALDIIAPRGTHVLAVEDGVVVKLFYSVRGGLTVYQFDPAEKYAYYYAHLDAYAPGLRERAAVRRGQLLGFVGTTGNAPEQTPHLHFAVFLLTEKKQWWQGTPINPFAVWRDLPR